MSKALRARKKPVTVDAWKWERHGDHSAVEKSAGRNEGSCRHCGQRMTVHGWVKTLEGGHIVCPGDYIIAGVKGELYPCKPDIFEETYEIINEDQDQ